LFQNVVALAGIASCVKFCGIGILHLLNPFCVLVLLYRLKTVSSGLHNFNFISSQIAH